MAELIQHYENDEKLAFMYEGKRIFNTKLTVYKFTTSCTFKFPLDGGNHDFASPVIRTIDEENFHFAWRLSCKVRRESYLNHFTMSLLKFDKQHLKVCVRCYSVADDDELLHSSGKLLSEVSNFDFSDEAPIEYNFSLSDRDLHRVYQKRLVELLKHKQNLLNKFDSILLVVRVDFEISEMDPRVRTSLKLAKDLETMLKPNDELTDVTFEIGGKELKAHKCILAARSRAFAKMFKAQETHDNRYRIDDIDADVFQHLLVFVYCGKTEDARSSNKLTELRLAAKKFDLKV